jgi:hypothetical protein
LEGVGREGYSFICERTDSTSLVESERVTTILPFSMVFRVFKEGYFKETILYTCGHDDVNPV